jgi:cyclophilin family peptidyl-prolyl cis-trans isomerase
MYPISRGLDRLTQAPSLVLGGLLLLSVSGCGAGLAAQDQRESPSPAAGTAVLLASCWSDDQRTEGENGMAQYSQPPAMRIDPEKRYTGTMTTNKGTIEFELYPEDAPKTVNNFVCLASDDYFNGTPFHRIVKGFVIQGGDPTGTGMGGPGYKFEDEPVSRDYERGILAMANAGPNTNGSQFFIVLEDLRGKLPKNYTIFGKVTGGLDVVEEIANTPTRAGSSGENSSPTEPVTLERVTVQES